MFLCCFECLDINFKLFLNKVVFYCKSIVLGIEREILFIYVRMCLFLYLLYNVSFMRVRIWFFVYVVFLGFREGSVGSGCFILVK